jgi:hypothetical protein
MEYFKIKFKVIWLVTSIALILVLQSCIRRQYKVQVENRTTYSLDTVAFRMGDKDHSVTLPSGQTSEIIIASYKFTFLNFFAAGGIGMHVAKYSDNDSSYTNNIGGWWNAGELSYKKVNKFIITKTENSPNNGGKFNIKLE